MYSSVSLRVRGVALGGLRKFVKAFHMIHTYHRQTQIHVHEKLVDMYLNIFFCLFLFIDNCQLQIIYIL